MCGVGKINGGEFAVVMFWEFVLNYDFIVFVLIVVVIVVVIIVCFVCV